MMSRVLKATTLLLGTGLLVASPSLAAGDKDLGVFKKWQAHSYTEGGGKVCNMWSRPTKHEEGGRARGEIFAFITHRPNDSRYHEVSLGMGYPLKKDSRVKVKIGGKNFEFFTHGSVAYAFKKDDKAIVKAMRGGNTMVVSGVSQRGTKTKDTYSLSGFSKANNAVNNACNVKKP
ncbi:invasion associated locus B family protein [Curvivirga aplysinae]|uniref:invasion associated locus B family protein n=1 Tax=Curvivirga aplysinae TaxID=2529852 RepID=UPI0012BC67C1|nr:invasion associated locus B family protein [Curvivirga aplysinae]MTI11201.1 hypothetical protein [Curvivirga aplysinae]